MGGIRLVLAFLSFWFAIGRLKHWDLSKILSNFMFSNEFSELHI